MTLASIVVIAMTVSAWSCWVAFEKRSVPTVNLDTHWLAYGMSFKAPGTFFAMMFICAPSYELFQGRYSRAAVIGAFILLTGGPVF